MSWLVLTLLSVLVVSVANILQKVLMKGDSSNPYSYGVVFHFLIGFLNLGFALAYGSHLSLFSGNFLLLLLVSFLWGACTVLVFKAVQTLEASEVIVVSTLRVVVTVAASVIFLHEAFNGHKIVGAIIIIVSTLLVVNFEKGFKVNKGLLYVLGVALVGGLAIVVDAVNVQHYDVIAYNTMTNFLIGFMLLGFYPKALGQWRHFIQPSFLKKMLPLAVFSTVQGILYLLALAHGGNTAQVGTIRQASVIVTVLLAVVFLRERDNLWRKVAAAVLVTLGVVLLS
jgi:uncharacterized membrane protein